MKYYIDTEFLEGTQKENFPISLFRKNTPPTIDLISIGIVSEDGREYYEISKDFNLKEAWNRFDLKETSPAKKRLGFYVEEIYWIRENVLMPIFFELAEREFHNVHFKDEWAYEGKVVDLEVFKSNKVWTSNFTWFKKLIKKYGKTNKQIAQEVKNFCYLDKETKDNGGQFVSGSFIPNQYPNIELYGYYSAYDHVALCWLFGKMMDLPKGFPMYCKDLKQILDEKAIEYDDDQYSNLSLDGKINYLKTNSKYPKQSNEHNALEDARWNKQLHEFLNSI